MTKILLSSCLIFTLVSCRSNQEIDSGDNYFHIDRFQSMYEIYPDFDIAQTVVVDYDRINNAYTKFVYSSSNTQVILSSDQDQLSKEQENTLSEILDSLSPRQYKTVYKNSNSDSAALLDGSYVISKFFSGQNVVVITMDTASQSTVPRSLMKFCNSIRNEEIF